MKPQTHAELLAWCAGNLAPEQYAFVCAVPPDALPQLREILVSGRVSRARRFAGVCVHGHAVVTVIDVGGRHLALYATRSTLGNPAKAHVGDGRAPEHTARNLIPRWLTAEGQEAVECPDRTAYVQNRWIVEQIEAGRRRAVVPLFTG